MNMIRLEGSNLEECVRSLMKLKPYAPYKFGGTWYVGFMLGEGYAYRTQKALLRRAGKAEIKEVTIAIIEG